MLQVRSNSFPRQQSNSFSVFAAARSFPYYQQIINKSLVIFSARPQDQEAARKLSVNQVTGKDFLGWYCHKKTFWTIMATMLLLHYSKSW